MGSTASGPRTRPGAPQAAARPTIAAVGATTPAAATADAGSSSRVEHGAVAARDHDRRGRRATRRGRRQRTTATSSTCRTPRVRRLEHGREHLAAAAVDERHEPARRTPPERPPGRQRERRQRGHARERGPPVRLRERTRRGDADAQAGEGAGAEADGDGVDVGPAGAGLREDLVHERAEAAASAPGRSSARRSATTEPSAAHSAAEHAVVAVSSARITTLTSAAVSAMPRRIPRPRRPRATRLERLPRPVIRAARLLRVRCSSSMRRSAGGSASLPGRRPLDERDRVRPEVVVPGEQCRVGAAAEPVQVEVVQQLAVAPVVALRQGERRAGDGAAHAAGAQHLTDQRRLAGAEVALDGDERRRLQRSRPAHERASASGPARRG